MRIQIVEIWCEYNHILSLVPILRKEPDHLENHQSLVKVPFAGFGGWISTFVHLVHGILRLFMMDKCHSTSQSANWSAIECRGGSRGPNDSFFFEHPSAALIQNAFHSGLDVVVLLAELGKIEDLLLADRMRPHTMKLLPGVARDSPHRKGRRIQSGAQASHFINIFTAKPMLLHVNFTLFGGKGIENMPLLHSQPLLPITLFQQSGFGRFSILGTKTDHLTPTDTDVHQILQKLIKSMVRVAQNKNTRVAKRTKRITPHEILRIGDEGFLCALGQVSWEVDTLTAGSIEGIWRHITTIKFIFVIDPNELQLTQSDRSASTLLLAHGGLKVFPELIEHVLTKKAKEPVTVTLTSGVDWRIEYIGESLKIRWFS
ncbi:hypothetical protein HG530_000347 [Fusarium avenaceum]|nr:hypothetical protein HG530_000347 [Fusarium avenaceum]